MVGLNPVLQCLIQVEEGVSRGEAVRDILLCWVDRSGPGSASHPETSSAARKLEAEILILLRQSESESGGSLPSELFFSDTSILRQTFFNILLYGVAGHSILSRLHELRIEIEQQLELDLKAHVDSLPLKMLVPLLLFMFPAFLILLLGPITSNFMEALK